MESFVLIIVDVGFDEGVESCEKIKENDAKRVNVSAARVTRCLLDYLWCKRFNVRKLIDIKKLGIRSRIFHKFCHFNFYLSVRIDHNMLRTEINECIALRVQFCNCFNNFKENRRNLNFLKSSLNSNQIS